MAIEIGALRAMLSLDTAAFERGAKRAEASMGNVQRRMSRLGRNMSKFGKTMSARVTAPIAAVGAVAVRSSMQTIDAQGKMAESLGTTTASLQVLARAADTAGISQGDLEGALTRMTRRISLAEQGTGPAAEALERLNLAAEDLSDLSADERIKLIQQRIAALIPAAQQAGVSSQIFGERVGIAMTRLDASQIEQAEQTLKRFGVAVTEVETDKIERANDAISALGLVARGLANQITVALAPSLEAIAAKIADISERFSKLSPTVKTITVALTGFAAAIGPLSLALGGVAKGITAMIGGMKLALPAIAALGGPLTIIAAVIGTVAAGMILFGDKTKVATPHLDAAAKAQEALNVALGTFSDTAAPSAAAEAINLANTMAQEAKEAMDAARSQIALAEARQAALESSIDTARTQGLRQRADEQAAAARERLAAAEDALAEAERARDRVAREVTGGPLALPNVNVEGDNAADTIRTLGDVANEVFGSGGSATSAVSEGASAIQDSLAGIGEGASRAADRFGDMAAGLVTGSQKIGDVLSRLGEQLLSSVFSNIGSAMGIGQSSEGLLGMGNFLGFLDKGGMIPSGKFAIAGERGPEIVTGPAQVTSRRKTADMLSGVGAGQASKLEVTLSPDLEARILRQSEATAVQITSAGIMEYDRNTLPERFQDISNDPRRRG
ncbi:hypothetical protein [Salibaculum halophilum]|uniref:hypothetical protein n=1 Tax=Salibaculum halophilum TaxID=1914408 RepID=UPI000A10828E|nr:hypothetical protein [Salibaculum halophilum]